MESTDDIYLDELTNLFLILSILDDDIPNMFVRPDLCTKLLQQCHSQFEALQNTTLGCISNLCADSSILAHFFVNHGVFGHISLILTQLMEGYPPLIDPSRLRLYIEFGRSESVVLMSIRCLRYCWRFLDHQTFFPFILSVLPLFLSSYVIVSELSLLLADVLRNHQAEIHTIVQTSIPIEVDDLDQINSRPLPAVFRYVLSDLAEHLHTTFNKHALVGTMIRWGQIQRFKNLPTFTPVTKSEAELLSAVRKRLKSIFRSIQNFVRFFGILASKDNDDSQLLLDSGIVGEMGILLPSLRPIISTAENVLFSTAPDEVLTAFLTRHASGERLEGWELLHQFVDTNNRLAQPTDDDRKAFFEKPSLIVSATSYLMLPLTLITSTNEVIKSFSFFIANLVAGTEAQTDQFLSLFLPSDPDPPLAFMTLLSQLINSTQQSTRADLVHVAVNLSYQSIHVREKMIEGDLLITLWELPHDSTTVTTTQRVCQISTNLLIPQLPPNCLKKAAKHCLEMRAEEQCYHVLKSQRSDVKKSAQDFLNTLSQIVQDWNLTLFFPTQASDEMFDS